MKKLIIAAFAVTLFGCSTVTRWEPTLNTGVGKNTANASKDLAECKVLALKAAGYLEDGAAGTVVGATGGAVEGAIIGALISGAGGAGVAAGVGAPIGAVAGLWWAEYEADLTFRRSYSQCLYQRGQYPVN